MSVLQIILRVAPFYLCKLDIKISLCYTFFTFEINIFSITIYLYMKKDIHPISRPTIFVDTSCGAEFISQSTLKTNETRKVNGMEYQIVNMEISSASHPFYTGKQILVDTARRVEKFQEKAAKAKSTAEVRKGKKAKRAKETAKKVAKSAKSKEKK